MPYAPKWEQQMKEREREREWCRHPAFAYQTLALRKSKYLEAFSD
jgi:hypothetical protein